MAAQTGWSAASSPCWRCPICRWPAANAANALAALALCEAGLGLEPKSLVVGLLAFRGLPHRVELVAERADGVRFYDDSKGTNVGATVAALAGFDRPVVLIAGGDGKGQDFSPLAPVVAGKARAVMLIGRDAGRIEGALTGCGVPTERAADLEGPSYGPTRSPRRVTWCCCRPRAPVSTCSATTRTVPKSSSRRYAACRRCPHDEARSQPRGSVRRRCAQDRERLARRRPFRAWRQSGARTRPAPDLVCRGPAAAGPGDGVFGVDRNRRGQSFHWLPVALFRDAARGLSCGRARCWPRRLPAADGALAATLPGAVRRWRGPAHRRADSGRRP